MNMHIIYDRFCWIMLDFNVHHCGHFIAHYRAHYRTLYPSNAHYLYIFARSSTLVWCGWTLPSYYYFISGQHSGLHDLRSCLKADLRQPIYHHGATVYRAVNLPCAMHDAFKSRQKTAPVMQMRWPTFLDDVITSEQYQLIWKLGFALV